MTYDSRDPPSIIPPLPRRGHSVHPLCPVSTLREYHARSSQPPCHSLLTDANSNKPFTAAKLAMIITKIVLEANPSSNPTSHDVRRLASSIAVFRYMDFRRVQKGGHWASAFTFWKCYNTNIFSLRNEVVALGSIG